MQGQGQGQGLTFQGQGLILPRPRPRPLNLALRPRPRPRPNITASMSINQCQSGIINVAKITKVITKIRESRESVIVKRQEKIYEIGMSLVVAERQAVRSTTGRQMVESSSSRGTL